MESAPVRLPQDVPERDLRHALDRTVADSVLLIYGVLAGLFGVFAFFDPLLYPGEAGRIVSRWDATTTVLFIAGFLYLWKRGVTAKMAHPALLASALVPTVDILHNLVLLRDPSQTLFLLLVVIGAGALMLDARYLAPIVILALAGWAGVAMAFGDQTWAMYGFALLAAGVIAGLVLTVRTRSYRRLHVLHFAAERANLERDVREQALESAVLSAWESEERYRRLVEQAPDAFLVHTDGRVVYANAAAVRLFGAKDQEELLGRDPLTLVHPDDVEALRERTARVQRDHASTDLREMRIKRLDGRDLDVEMTGQPISYLGKTADQTIIRDITDRKRAHEETRVAVERLGEIARLKEMDRMKTQFVNTLSHELRTPLTPIKVQLHLLKSAHASGDVERQNKATEMLERNVTRMGGLIDELLEVARLQTGNLKLDKGDVDLEATLTETLESFRDVAKQNGVDVQMKLEHGIHVEADARRLTQVMYNLLNNALKFTPSGGRILVDAREKPGRAVVSVTDSGMGIKPEDIQRLFEPFSQVHDTMQKTNAGTGLGLYICKGIVEGHGGTIHCQSPGPGKGTTFTFELPTH